MQVPEGCWTLLKTNTPPGWLGLQKQKYQIRFQQCWLTQSAAQLRLFLGHMGQRREPKPKSQWVWKWSNRTGSGMGIKSNYSRLDIRRNFLWFLTYFWEQLGLHSHVFPTQFWWYKLQISSLDFFSHFLDVKRARLPRALWKIEQIKWKNSDPFWDFWVTESFSANIHPTPIPSSYTGQYTLV